MNAQLCDIHFDPQQPILTYPQGRGGGRGHTLITPGWGRYVKESYSEEAYGENPIIWERGLLDMQTLHTKVFKQE